MLVGRYRSAMSSVVFSFEAGGMFYFSCGIGQQGFGCVYFGPTIEIMIAIDRRVSPPPFRIGMRACACDLLSVNDLMKPRVSQEL